jgi:CRP/FNR family transcriptional regulator
MGAIDARFEHAETPALTPVTAGLRGDWKPRRHLRLIEGVLANLPLMEGVSRPVVRQLATQSTVIIANRGETVVCRGDPVPGVFVIAYGSVKKRLQYRRGSELVLAVLGHGETFAEVPGLLARAARVDVVTLAESLFVVIDAASIRAQAQSSLPLARNMMNAVARRFDALLDELERRMLPGLQRLAAYLDSIAEPGGAPGTWIARLPVSKTLVAAQLDITKETLSRMLRRLVARGLIRVARREIIILDRHRLAAVTR